MYSVESHGACFLPDPQGMWAYQCSLYQGPVAQTAVSCFSLWILPGWQPAETFCATALFRASVLDITFVILRKLTKWESFCHFAIQASGKDLTFCDLPFVEIKGSSYPFNRKGRAVFSGGWLLFRYLRKGEKPPQLSAPRHSSWYWLFEQGNPWLFSAWKILLQMTHSKHRESNIHWKLLPLEHQRKSSCLAPV